jgi:hypothetical protein
MGKPFDELSKALAKGVSRRQALKALFASLAGTTAATAFAERTAFAANPSHCTGPQTAFCAEQELRCVVVNGSPVCV